MRGPPQFFYPHAASAMPLPDVLLLRRRLAPVDPAATGTQDPAGGQSAAGDTASAGPTLLCRSPRSRSSIAILPSRSAALQTELVFDALDQPLWRVPLGTVHRQHRSSVTKPHEKMPSLPGRKHATATSGHRFGSLPVKSYCDIHRAKGQQKCCVPSAMVGSHNYRSPSI